MREMHKHKALAQMGLRDLQRWAKVYRQRDRLVYQAYVSGVGVNQIALASGLAKTTVIRILREVQGQ